MKMLGFMIALTLIYWVMASFAHNIVTGSAPCPADSDSADIFTAEAASPARATEIYLEASLTSPDDATRGSIAASCAS